MLKSKLLYKWVSIGVAVLFLFAVGVVNLAQDDDTTPADEDTAAEVVVEEAEEPDPSTVPAMMSDVGTVQGNLDLTWILLAGFLVFFMQAGFAMLEGGFIRHTGVVNSMMENFMDAAITALVFFAVGYGLAFGDTAGGWVGTSMFFLGGADGTLPEHGGLFVGAFFQFAFAGAAATIVTGAMAERTHFIGKMMYSAVVGAFIYPVVVHWVWQGEGFLTGLGFLDFAGSTVVHQTGGFIALMGALIVGPRPNREFGNPPRPHNMMMATLGTFILWFGWYGFNVGSTLAATDTNIMGLVAINTTLAAAAGALSAMFITYTRTRNWDLSFVLNGSLAGLVGITAGCAFVTPTSAVIIGVIAGLVVVLAVDMVEAAKIDDAVGAFAVHGAAGMWGTLAIGLFGVEGLTGSTAGILSGGGADLLIAQAIGVVAVAAWTTITSGILFFALKTLGMLRISEHAEQIGIDAAEHGASLWPDVLPIDDATPEGAGD